MSSAEEQMLWVDQVHGEFSHLSLFARYTEIVGLKIVSIHYDDNWVSIAFEDGRTLTIRDEGQSCCEARYMTCDDDLSGHEGGQLLSVHLDAAGPPAGTKLVEDDDNYGGECHEQQFVKVQTTKGSFTLCAHNEHNGYYGGFSLAMSLR